jgi:hypothetical protein
MYSCRESENKRDRKKGRTGELEKKEEKERKRAGGRCHGVASGL